MTGNPKKPAMIGMPPSASQVPLDAGLHAQDFARRWVDKLEEYCADRMAALGIPEGKKGEPDYDSDGRWRTFDPNGRKGGDTVTGVVIDSGVLKPDLLKGKKGGKLWREATLRDRIDASIAHEWEESRHGSHETALEAAANTKLPISDRARRICRAMAR